MNKYLLCLFVLLLTGSWQLSAQAELVSFTQRNDLLGPASGGISNSDCAVDMNKDGLDDIVRVQNDGINVDYQRTDGTFSHQFFPVSFSNSPNWSICAADIDENGYTDLLFGGGTAVSFVMANGDGTAYSEFYNSDYIFSQRSTFYDIDRDGDLDAFVCHDVDLSHPYRNDGLGNMVEDQDLIHTVNLPGNYAAIWVDYNNDSYTDLYITKCRGGAQPGDPARTNGLYRNNGDGTFTEVGEEANMADNAQSWATVFEDFDNDGDFDAFIVNHDFANRFMLNNGDGTFTDTIASTGIPPGDLGAWENAAGDFNNDGFVDIFSELGNELYLNNGDLTFTGQNLPDFDEGGIGDFNNDGFLDVVRGNSIYLNDGNDNNWIKITTEGLISNKDGIGARVEIYGTFGRQIREIRAGQSFSPMSSHCAHFGLGQAAVVDSVVVLWPSGIRTMIENPEINRGHNILEASCTLDPETIEVMGSIELCEGETVELIAPGGYDEILWSTGGTNPTLEVSQPGSYGLTLFDESGCAAVAQNIYISRVVDVAPTIAIDGDREFCAGGAVTLTVNGGDNPLWTNGEATPVIEVTESGIYNVAVDARCSEEQISAIESIEVEVFTPNNPAVETINVDMEGVAQITATGENLVWYAEAEGGAPIGTGNTFITDPLTEDATFYVEATETFGGGIESGAKLTTDGGGGVPQVGAWNYFDAYTPFTLLTVDALLPENRPEGPRTIQLVDGDDVILDEIEVDVVHGLQTLTLNFEVPAGVQLSLRLDGEPLFRNNSGVEYPYRIGDDVGEVTSSFYGDQYYYYFYNWQVETPTIDCTSPRLPVQVTIVNIAEIPEVGSVRLFPNPVQTDLRVELNVVERADLQLNLLNALGQVVYQQSLTDNGIGEQVEMIDVSQLPSGIYQLQVQVGDRAATYKVVVE